jgi:4-hydroxy-tetrahydrodipicolinate synthase
MCAAAQAGERERALTLDAQLQPLHKNLFLEPNPIPVKWALQQMGLIPRGIRLPMTPLSQQYHAPVREALVSAGVLK